MRPVYLFKNSLSADFPLPCLGQILHKQIFPNNKKKMIIYFIKKCFFSLISRNLKKKQNFTCEVQSKYYTVIHGSFLSKRTGKNIQEKSLEYKQNSLFWLDEIKEISTNKMFVF